jgi:carboxyl-terminal processing protease
MKFRTGDSNFRVYPQKTAFGGKIVILTDYATSSTSEIFAAGLQETGRAKIVGEISAGAVLPSVIEKLPTGALFQYAISDYKSPKKILIEGRGVKPDIEINLTRRSLLQGKDLQMETAIREILRTK